MAFTQDSVNQLVQQAATQAGGTLSYADASNAAKNLGISDAMLQGALSTGMITGAPAPVAGPPVNYGGPLSFDVATDLMQRSMTTGVPTSEFDRYGGYGAVQSLYDSGGGSYTMSDINPALLQNYANQVANTGTGNLSTLAATNTPLTRAGIGSLFNRGLDQDTIRKSAQVYGDPARLAQENARYLQEQADIKERIRAENLESPRTFNPLYTSLTGKSNPGAVAAAYAQLADRAGGDTAKNQQEATAYLRKIGVSDADILQGYNFYKGSGATTGAAGATPAGVTPTGTGALTTDPLYKGLTSKSTADDIARAYYQLTSGAGGDTPENQKQAVAYLQKLGITDPLIQGGYKDYREMADLKSKFGVTDGAAKPTAEGIISGFKYANDSGISEKDMEQVLGKDAFNTYKTGLADYAKTGIAGILADKDLSFNEALQTVKFGRALGYDPQKLADLTGTDKKIFDTIYKYHDDTSKRVITEALKQGPDVTNETDQIAKAFVLGEKLGFTDDDFARALGYKTEQIKSAFEPVRTFQSDLNKVFTSPDSTLADAKKIIESGKNNGVVDRLFGKNLGELDTKIAEIEDRWKDVKGVNPMQAQRVYDQISQQREKLGDQHYRGVFGDPKTMSATLVKKGINTLADIGQKDKFEAVPSEKRYFGPDGTPLIYDGSQGVYGVQDGEGGIYNIVPKDKVRTEYGYTETNLIRGPEDEATYHAESKFIPLSEKDVDKDGNYQKLMGKVAFNKRTGEEIADLSGQIAGQNSSGGLNKKWNTLDIQFGKNGVPIITASSQRTGLGGLVQDLAPMISMALPFVLPGLGAALSGMLPGAAVAASGTAAAIPATLLNKALTQGIISGGLTTLGGGQFEKGFLSGAVSPVINAGISSVLPSVLPAGLSENATNAIKGVGTNVLRNVIQGESFKDSLGEGILSGLANYGLGEATKGLNLSPQQLNFATGIALPTLQGQKVNPIKLMTTLASMDQQQSKGITP